MPTKPFSVPKAALTLALVLVAAATAAVFALGGDTPGSTRRVRADPNESLSLGYFDQTEVTFFAVELGEANALEGGFYLAVPGVGVFWPDGPLSIVEELDGSLTLSYDDSGYLDDEAVMDSSSVFRMEASGSALSVEFELAGTLSEDRSTVAVTLTYDSQVFTVDSSPAPANAGAILDDAMDHLEAEDFAALRLLFVEACWKKSIKPGSSRIWRHTSIPGAKSPRWMRLAPSRTRLTQDSAISLRELGLP